jgi:hypothetical protein
MKNTLRSVAEQASLWAQAQALRAMSLTESVALEASQKMPRGGGWRESRARVGKIAQIHANAALALLADEGVLRHAPHAHYEMESRSFSTGKGVAQWAHGAVEIGSLSIPAWPARMQMMHYEEWEISAPPLWTPQALSHATLAAATALGGGYAERLAAASIAKRALRKWVDVACSRPELEKSDAGFSLLASFERQALSKAAPDASSPGPARQRL